MSNESVTLSSSNTNLKIVKTEVTPNGEAVQLVRPLPSTGKTTDQIIGELVTRFDYKTNDVKASDNELNTVHQAFGSNLAQELIKTYEGSNLVSDSQQDLIGERYLAEQIRLIEEQQKKSSILDKWSHLLYEGEKDYQPSSQSQLPQMEVGSLRGVVSNGSSSQYNMILQQGSQPPPMSQLRSSHSGNLIASNSQHGLAASQRDLQSRLTQNSHSQSQAEAQFQAQAEAIARAEAEARAQDAQSRPQYSQSQYSQSQFGHQSAQYAPSQTQSQANLQAQKSRTQSQSQINNQHLNRSASQHTAQQPQPYLPQLSSSNLNSVTLDAYNSPQFKAMLDQLTKPISIPPENINYPPEWPTQDKINLLCEPIYIPAPQPIVIPAPNIIAIQNQQFDNSGRLPEASLKPTVSYYPSIGADQSQLKEFGIRQLS